MAPAVRLCHSTSDTALVNPDATARINQLPPNRPGVT